MSIENTKKQIVKSTRVSVGMREDEWVDCTAVDLLKQLEFDSSQQPNTGCF